MVLVFPSAQAKGFAAHATLQVIQPSASGDLCPQFLAYPPLVPMAAQIEQTSEVDLANGAATKPLQQIPVGRQTLLVSISDKTNTLFLRGCLTTNVTAGAKLEITLQPIVPAMPDMTTRDLSSPDLFMPPQDMAMHQYLSITVNELRAATRKVMGATVGVTDSASGSVSGTTDANGFVKLDTVGFVPPLTISATAPAVNMYQGISTVTSVMPTFTTDTITMNLPVELDPPPAIMTPNQITATVSDTTSGQVYTVYWVSNSALVADIAASASVASLVPVSGAVAKASAANGSQAFPTSPVAAGNFRFAVGLNTGAAGSPLAALATPLPVSGPPENITFQNAAGAGQLIAFSSTLALTVNQNATAAPAYTSQTFGISLVLPAPPAQAQIPIVPETTAIGANPQTAQKVPPTLSAIQPSAFATSAVIANSATTHAELRKEYTTFAATATDTIGPPPDPPTVALNPGATFPHTIGVTVTATPPGAFPLANGFLHINIHDTANPQKYHWHIVATAANPTVITIPANVLAAGTYAMDVAFQANFALVDGTVNATLTDDFSKLIRVVPLELTQSTTTLTVN